MDTKVKLGLARISARVHTLLMNNAAIQTGSKIRFHGNMGADAFDATVTLVSDGYFWFIKASGEKSKAPSPVGLLSTTQWSVLRTRPGSA